MSRWHIKNILDRGRLDMKSEWRNFLLEDVCEKIYSGDTPSTKHPEYWGGNLKWLSSGETSQRFIYDTERKITQLGADNSSTKLATKGCTVIATAGQGYTRGQASFLMTDTYMNQSVIACKPNVNIIEPLFLYYNLDNRYEEFRLLSDGTSTRGGLSGWILKRMEVIIPPLQEQRKIAGILKSLDDKIELNNAINKNLEEQAQAIFRSWLDLCPNKTTIEELSQNILDYTPNTNEIVKLLNSSDVTEGLFSDIPFVKNEKLKGHFKKRFKKHDILYSEIRPRNHHYGYVYFDSYEDYICSTRLMVIRANTEKTTSNVLYQYLLSTEVESEFTLKTESRSGTFPQGNYADMSSIVVPYNNIDSQQQLDNILSSIRQRIALNLDENVRLSKLRDTLLPRLISGELDVSNLDL
ncbi:MAG: restriction endonuclease subunit S [Ruminococcus sp.]|nr:restriction endonuclease subunit S [Ruminococcus sp.]